MTIIDTRLHLIYRDVLRYPWIKDVPPLQQDFSAQRYRSEAVRCGIEAALHMEVDVDEADIEAETKQFEAPVGRARASAMSGD